ncbi:Oidioi.mRNA.OKI2018_I69.PAR.g10855.t2.cds [Oikopleura dioica]|nr:Oidioi.mRNA.OKI2018_I69.PAR.g10855.t2.cds [Oikopleura dioica]
MVHLDELRARVATTEKLNYKSEKFDNFKFNTGHDGTKKAVFNAEDALKELKETKVKLDSFKNETRVRQIMASHKGASASKLVPERNRVPYADRPYQDPMSRTSMSTTQSDRLLSPLHQNRRSAYQNRPSAPRRPVF